MLAPARTNDRAATWLELTSKDSDAEPNSVPLVSKMVAVHCGCDTGPEDADNPARVNPKDCNGVAKLKVKPTGWLKPAWVKKLGEEGTPT